MSTKSCSNSHLSVPFIWSQNLEAMTILADITSSPLATRQFDFSLLVNVALQENTHAQGSKLVGSLSDMPDLHTLRALNICSGL